MIDTSAVTITSLVNCIRFSNNTVFFFDQHSVYEQDTDYVLKNCRSRIEDLFGPETVLCFSLFKILFTSNTAFERKYEHIVILRVFSSVSAR